LTWATAGLRQLKLVLTSYFADNQKNIHSDRLNKNYYLHNRLLG
jgi:hypothetical protein